MSLQGKKIILGITGSIAAYKSAVLCRLLIREGAEVRIVMTSAARDFITPLTLSTLSQHPVYHAVHDGENWTGHVALGLWADLMVIAPITANSLAHLALGLCDNMLDAVYLSARCPVMFAPAMDLDMWNHAATQANVRRLLSFGNHMIPVENGALASGLTGLGRMAEPEHIVAEIQTFFTHKYDLAGMKVMITAGPTHERIDPVRFIGNASSGKMGIALALECVRRGADVHLISGPLSVPIPEVAGLQVTRVTTAAEMYESCISLYPEMDMGIMAAAVADYTPETVAGQKIKKTDGALEIKLVRTKDIAGALGASKKPGQTLVGFALETENELEHAKAKRARKNFDLIVLNSLNDPGAGFGSDTNKVTIIGTKGVISDTTLLSKEAIAAIIIDETIKIL